MGIDPDHLSCRVVFVIHSVCHEMEWIAVGAKEVVDSFAFLSIHGCGQEQAAPSCSIGMFRFVVPRLQKSFQLVFALLSRYLLKPLHQFFDCLGRMFQRIIASIHVFGRLPRRWDVVVVVFVPCRCECSDPTCHSIARHLVLFLFFSHVLRSCADQARTLGMVCTSSSTTTWPRRSTSCTTKSVYLRSVPCHGQPRTQPRLPPASIRAGTDGPDPPDRSRGARGSTPTCASARPGCEVRGARGSSRPRPPPTWRTAWELGRRGT
mmetsp:Transcript_1183/g.7711  ORF Transcript_1183/g.7711 Transcript_1183/m.7711 type:complete len:264 (+) Transcript_1183:2224-3015(+)